MKVTQTVDSYSKVMQDDGNCVTTCTTMAKTTAKAIALADGSVYLKDGDRELDLATDWEEWQNFLAEAQSFRFSPYSSTEAIDYSAQKLLRGDESYWYAYKRYKGQLKNTYIAKASELNSEALNKAAKRLFEIHNPDRVTQNSVIVTQADANLLAELQELRQWKASAEKALARSGELDEANRQLRNGNFKLNEDLNRAVTRALNAEKKAKAFESELLELRRYKDESIDRQEAKRLQSINAQLEKKYLSLNQDLQKAYADLDEETKRCNQIFIAAQNTEAAMRTTIAQETAKLNQAQAQIADLQKEISDLRRRPPAELPPQALTLLEEALELKPNAGGAIKQKIREAVALLKSPEFDCSVKPPYWEESLSGEDLERFGKFTRQELRNFLSKDGACALDSKGDRWWRRDIKKSEEVPPGFPPTTKVVYSRGPRIAH